MKTKMLLLVAVIGTAALSASAEGRFTVFSTSPVVCAPPAPVVVAAEIPPCPGADYIWTPGYWSVSGAYRVWVPGAWHYRAGRFAHHYDGYRR